MADEALFPALPEQKEPQPEVAPLAPPRLYEPERDQIELRAIDIDSLIGDDHADLLDRLMSEHLAALANAGLVKLETLAQDGVRIRAFPGEAVPRGTGPLRLVEVPVTPPFGAVRALHCARKARRPRALLRAFVARQTGDGFA